jgi:hypothetical protein
MERQIVEHLSYNFLQHARSLYNSPAVYITCEKTESRRVRTQVRECTGVA